jgi:7-cyano-7-deazaguanine synthase
MQKIVLLLSGGLDSAVLLWRLLDQGDQVHALCVAYGQRHLRELAHAHALARRAGVPLVRVDLAGAAALFAGSGLIGEGDGQTTVVPNRNMVLISLALAHAIQVGAYGVAYAAHAGDHDVYPDCRPEFSEAMDRVASICHHTPLRVIRPFGGYLKSDLVRLGASLGVPLELTYSCYAGGDTHCGCCAACRERRAAFRLAKMPDPTAYGAE